MKKNKGGRPFPNDLLHFSAAAKSCTFSAGDAFCKPWPSSSSEYYDSSQTVNRDEKCRLAQRIRRLKPIECINSHAASAMTGAVARCGRFEQLAKQAVQRKRRL
eukprot:4024918-Pleurochrysis_carterae.AAC.1